jgi:hypothetical protein
MKPVIITCKTNYPYKKEVKEASISPKASPYVKIRPKQKTKNKKGKNNSVMDKRSSSDKLNKT